MQKVSAIITGDIVASSKMTSESRAGLYADFKVFMTSLKLERWISAFELFRGDGMQCIAQNKEQVLRVALMVRAWLKSYRNIVPEKHLKNAAGISNQTKNYFAAKHDIRLSIGIGTADIVKSSMGHSDGEAFFLSGRGLDNLKGTATRITFHAADEKLTEAISPAILLLDTILEKWTSNQAEIILFKLKNLKEEEIAAKIGITQSAVNQRTKASGWSAINQLITWFEKTVKDRVL